MSTDSLALFRKSLRADLRDLADQHYKHDLTPTDRTALQQAARTVSTHAGIGSALGIALGLGLAWRIRRGRARVLATFQAAAGGAERPVAVRFASGREAALPDVAPLLRRPRRAADAVTFALLGFGGLFCGGEVGLLTGSLQARRQIARDGESGERIRRAVRRFQADALRAQAAALETADREGSHGVL